MCDSLDKYVIRSLIVFVTVGNVIYLVVRGKGIVYLKRKTELASLMHQDGAISGEVKLHDTLLLASDGFSGVLTREELSGLFDHLPAQEIAEKLTLMLHEKTGGEGSVALVFGVTEFSEPPSAAVMDSDEALDTLPPVDADAPDLDHTLPPPQVDPKKAEKSRRHFFDMSALGNKLKSIQMHPRFYTAIVPIFFTLLFIISVTLGVMKQSSMKKSQRVEAVLSGVQHALDEGVALLELNPAKGRERLEQAKAQLDPLRETVSTRTLEGRKVAQMYQSITDNLTQALHVTRTEPTLYYDISLVKKNGVIHAIARDEDELLVSDVATNTIYRMNIASKNAQIIGGGVDMKGSMQVTTHGTKSYVLTDVGIMEIASGAKKPTLIVKKDPEWGTISSLISFGGNLYLLDVVKSRIWKYVATEKGFSERREYLNPDTLPDLTRTSGMAIDGSVFLGNEDGTILRFTQGKENTYVVKGVDPKFGVSPMVYTSDDTKFVYVLDPKNMRIVVLDKEGMYVSQYQYTGVNPTSFVVYEAVKKIVLLSDGKLYTIDVK